MSPILFAILLIAFAAVIIGFGWYFISRPKTLPIVMLGGETENLYSQNRDAIFQKIFGTATVVSTLRMSLWRERIPLSLLIRNISEHFDGYETPVSS
jgi:hypothetical protein